MHQLLESLRRSTALVVALALLGSSALDADAPPAAQAPRPLKVVVLAGQSNMQGHAHVSTFGSMAGDPRTAPLLARMVDADGAPVVCERVWISSVGCLGDAYSDRQEAQGRLTAGFGAPEDKIGPEFTFGLTFERLVDEPVLLIKTAWGGRSLHTDFRPPSAGPYGWSDYELERLRERDEDLDTARAAKAEETGVYYRAMVEHVQFVLADIARVVPGYDAAAGYELAGFVWFQGFNDYVSDWTYDRQMEPGGYDLDLDAPALPVVVGVMGIGGTKEDALAPQMHFRGAQRAVAGLPEFAGNVVAVETAPFWNDELETLQQRLEQVHDAFDREAQQHPDWSDEERHRRREAAVAKAFSPREHLLLSGISNGGYHYLGAASILAPIGESFAEALVALRGAQQRREK
jgi:alpha-galactosidase